jgi:hypothetical protein
MPRTSGRPPQTRAFQLFWVHWNRAYKDGRRPGGVASLCPTSPGTGTCTRAQDARYSHYCTLLDADPTMMFPTVR